MPTRFSHRNASLIDQLFCKMSSPDTRNANVSGILINNLSDHLPYFSSLDICSPSKQTPKFILCHNNSPECIRQFYAYVLSEMSTLSFDTDTKANPTSNYEKLHFVLVSAREKILKPKLVRFNKYKHKLNPWMTIGILKSIKYRDKLYKKLKLMDNSSVAYSNCNTNLRTYKGILQKCIRAAKIDYYRNKFENDRNNIRKTWKTINEIMNRNKKSSVFPSHFIINGNKISDKEFIANNFNSFFANVGPNLSNTIRTNSTKSVKSYLKIAINSTFSFNMITSTDVIKLINELKPKHSAGHDNISTNLLKHIAPLIIGPLTVIINQSLCTGIFPAKLKIARVIPLYKKDDCHILDNYRPISLLTSISKVFEKVVFKQVYHYFTEKKLFYCHQYGFRTLHSTELAAMEMTDRVLQDLDNGKLPISVFLDLSKAFDTLDHCILLEKLWHLRHTTPLVRKLFIWQDSVYRF